MPEGQLEGETIDFEHRLPFFAEFGSKLKPQKNANVKSDMPSIVPSILYNSRTSTVCIPRQKRHAFHRYSSTAKRLFCIS